VYFEGSYDPNRQCISISGDGSAEIKFMTDATQLASVLSSLAAFKDCRIGIVLKKLSRNCPDEAKRAKKNAKIYR
jgi:hypothetical protein